MGRSETPGEARHCEIKAAPKEMYETDLPEIPRAESIKHAINRDDRLEKPRYGVGIIGPRSPIISKRNGIGNFIRATVELRRAAELRDQVQEARIELSNGHRAEREARSASIRCCANDRMVEKIESYLHPYRAVRDY
jgi:hypothetical protein